MFICPFLDQPSDPNIIGTMVVLSIIITLLSREFFTLAEDFSLEFEWQQVSTSFQDFSQYSGCIIFTIIATFSHQF